VVIHASGSPEVLSREITSEIRSMSPEASVRVQTLEQMFSSSTGNRRFNFALLSAFAGSALVLAIMGIYSVIAYSVAQRNQEIGIRRALGAPLNSIRRLFVAEGVRIIFLGSALGLAGAAGSSRLLRSLLFAVQPGDLTAYVLGILPLIIIGLIASLLPARRATQVDPMTTIRDA
jgi:ABC-type antimicrobial peptide transport system permease subunit